MDLSLMLKDISLKLPVTMEKVADIIDSVDETIKSVRKISSELRPGVLDDLGLIAALDWQSSEFEKRYGVTCSFISKVGDQEPERSINTGVFRIYQESLTNIARHANATEVKCTIHLENNYLILSIVDNGKGFRQQQPEQKRTLGIIGMQERAIMLGGDLKIKSEEGAGTKITLRVPIDPSILHLNETPPHSFPCAGFHTSWRTQLFSGRAIRLLSQRR
jgi:signal transduction histidine kinase